jgi:hypothetical protein
MCKHTGPEEVCDWGVVNFEEDEVSERLSRALEPLSCTKLGLSSKKALKTGKENASAWFKLLQDTLKTPS